jgi:hypothetical protein
VSKVYDPNSKHRREFNGCAPDIKKSWDIKR